MIKLSYIRKLIREELENKMLQQEDSEASRKAKQMGLDYYKFGRYGKDGVVTHISKKGKLIPVAKKVPNQNPDAHKINPGDKLAQKQSAMSQRDKYHTKYDAIAAPYVAKVDNALDTGNIKYNDEYPSQEFMKRTGLKPIEFKFLVKYNDIKGMDSSFYYDPNDDTVFVSNPEDI